MWGERKDRNVAYPNDRKWRSIMLRNSALSRTLILGLVTLVLLANMSIEPIITVYLEMLKVPKTRLVLDAGFIMAASAFGSILMTPRLGRLG
jgi:hypothetical protein